MPKAPPSCVPLCFSNNITGDIYVTFKSLVTIPMGYDVRSIRLSNATAPLQEHYQTVMDLAPNGIDIKVPHPPRFKNVSRTWDFTAAGSAWVLNTSLSANYQTYLAFVKDPESYSVNVTVTHGWYWDPIDIVFGRIQRIVDWERVHYRLLPPRPTCIGGESCAHFVHSALHEVEYNVRIADAKTQVDRS